MGRLRRFFASFACVGVRTGPTRHEDGGRETGSETVAISATVVNSLLKKLQDREGDRAETYRRLQHVLQGDDTRLQSGVVNRVLAEVSGDMKAAQGAMNNVTAAAGDVLVALARSHFGFVMSELQGHLKTMRGGACQEFVLTTLSKLASSYALRCIPFVEMTLLALHAMLRQVESSRILRTICSVLEQWSRAINAYFNAWEQCPFPRIGEKQLCEQVYSLFCHAVVNWLGRHKKEEDKQAIFGAVTAMMAVVLHDAQHQDRVWKQVVWLLQQYQEVQDTSRVTESLHYFLKTLEELHAVAPKDKLRAIAAAVHHELGDETRQHSAGHKEELRQCIVLQARIYPEETVTFLLSQLSSENQGSRGTALTLLGAVARSDEPAVREKLPLIVEAVQPLFTESGTQLRRALLGFIKDLLSVSIPSCLAWDVVAHIFVEFRRASDRLAVEDVQEERDLQAQCIGILESLDLSVEGMTELLWPRLLQYVVPAQYCGMLVPLLRCLQALIERQKQTEGQEDTEKPADVQEQAKKPTPQALLVRLLVVAACDQCRECAVAALQLLQALQSRIHSSLRGLWPISIPCMLQYLEEKTEGFLDSEEWQCYLLKFLTESVEEMLVDQPWVVCLSRELSQQLSNPSSSAEDKVCALPAPSWQHSPGAPSSGAGAEGARSPCGLSSPLPPPSPQRCFPPCCPGSATAGRRGCSLGCWGLSRPGPVLTSRAVTTSRSRSLLFQNFLYQALGTVLASCRQLTHVQEQLLKYLKETDATSPCDRQGIASVVSYAAERHFYLALDAMREFTQWLIAFDRRRKAQKGHQRAQAAWAAAMLTYGKVALHAPKSELLACVEEDILANILELFHACRKELQHKLALVNSIKEVTCAIQAADTKHSFRLCKKPEVLEILLDLMEEDACDTPVSQVHLKMLQLLEQLSTLKPCMDWEYRCSQVAVCCWRVLSCPPEETELQSLQTSCEEALGQLVSALLKAEGTSSAFADVVSILLCHLTSTKAWGQERALQVCAQLLGTYEELFKCSRERTCSQFGSLVGVLGPLLSDSQATSRQRAGACLSCLLRIQACGMTKTRRAVLQVPDYKELCERLKSTEDGSLCEDPAKIAKGVCQYFPQGQARSFMDAIMKTFECANEERAQAAGDWMIGFLEACGKEIRPEVPEVVNILWKAMYTMQQGTLRDLLFKAARLLAGFHLQPVVDSLLQTELPSERDMVQLWRSLGSSDLGPQVLRHLAERLDKAPETRPLCNDADQEPHRLKLLCAISEVVSALLTAEAVRDLLPHLLPVLLQWVSKELGVELLFPPLSPPRGLLLFKDMGQEEQLCGLYCDALEQVLRRCLDERWQQVLFRHGVWPSLDLPQWHCNSVQLLTSVLLRARLVSRALIQTFLPWLHSPLPNLQVTALAFFAELMKDPPAEGKDLLKPLVRLFLEKLQHPSCAVQHMAARGLGSAVSGLPKKVQKHKRSIVAALEREMRNVDHPEVAAESMLALAEILAKQTAKGLGGAFRRIARSTRKFLDAKQEDLRFAAFSLYTALAAGAKDNLTTFFSGEVEQILGSLFLHLQDPSCAVSSVCRTALYVCAPFVEPKGLQVVVKNAIGRSGAQLQSEVCSYLETHAPELLKTLKRQQKPPLEKRSTDATLHVLEASPEHKEGSPKHAEDIPEHAEDLSGHTEDVPELAEA
ncbi:maestro heat-like repeat-containing protein family member 2B [Anser cygnoides]|uniref:maestro heat-like repeat-containing protein family member 2B n=1 Tax=Anser cygnoides TaxID=8845 RepID=UPI0034D36DD1